jgi:small conductance mechanosensitive channel
MITEFFVKYSFQALGGIIVILVGILLSKVVYRMVGNLFEKKGVDVTVSKFMLSIVKILIIAFAVLIALGKFGITIAPFIAGISVIGFGTSFALQGPLSNYAAGITLIFTKPFKVGEIVEVSGVIGEVTDMTLARTELKTLDGTVIFVPNKSIIGEVIHNYSQFKKLDLTVGVSYSSDISKAISIVEGVIKQERRIAKDPVPKIGISEFADSSINIYARLWCLQSDYYDVLFLVNRKLFAEFGANGIEIPFPQSDIHIKDKV